jgi:hypothetical protein
MGRSESAVYQFPSVDFPSNYDGIVVRGSKRWATPNQIIQPGYKFPYLNKNGQFTGSTLVSFRCSAPQYIATLVATLYRRIETRALVHNKRSEVVKRKKLLLQAAYYYAVSKNAWFFDRLMALSRNLERHHKSIHHLVRNFTSKLDENKRFVYSQVSFQTNWLTSRALTRPRDKSTFKLSKRYGENDVFNISKDSYMQLRSFKDTAIAMSLLSPQRL